MATSLRELVERDVMTIAPGAWDGLTARLVVAAGYEAVYMTGAGVSASFGFPDYGLVTMTEMVDALRTMTRAIRVPVIADADTGYGNELNVRRTTLEFESAGAGALQIEDQLFPKRCGHLAGKQLSTVEDFVSRVASAVATRDRALVVARTDACGVLGFDAAVERANAALDAGADLAFVEAPQTIAEVAEIPSLVHGPCVFNLVRRGSTPEVDIDQLAEWGYRLTIVPGLLLDAVVAGAEAALAGIATTGRYGAIGRDLTVEERFEIFGARDWPLDDVALSRNS